ncbi:MAG: translation initiation factor IF-2, partial [Spirochaetae bacterium HGW-Spirochaetae-6]
MEEDKKKKIVIKKKKPTTIKVRLKKPEEEGEQPVVQEVKPPVTGERQAPAERKVGENPNRDRAPGFRNQGANQGYNREGNQGGSQGYNRGGNQGGNQGYNRDGNQGAGRDAGRDPKKVIIVKKTVSGGPGDKKTSFTRKNETPSPQPLEKGKSNKKVDRNDWKNKKNKKDEQRKEREREKEFQLQRRLQESLNGVPNEIEIADTILVKDLAKKMNTKAGDLIKKLMELGYMATINDALDAETAEIVASEFRCKVVVKSLHEEIQKIMDEQAEDVGEATFRPPVVTVMGHVDHGKTTLLDYIRTANVAGKESGGITQHIGAYQVKLPKGTIAFIDTPGHAAFTQMRERGAQATDVVILVVSADDGVMPQTIEAINHAKAAKVPIVVAINKMDKEGANPDRIKQQLAELELVPEDWGGDTMFLPISALKGVGIQELLDAVLLVAEVKEFKGMIKKKATGVIIETRIDKGRGSVATLIVRDGTLKKGDSFIAGVEGGRIRGMYDHNGQEISEATPSTPVEIMGFDALPQAGDVLQVVDSEKTAKEISSKRKELKRIEQAKKITKKVSLEDLYEKMHEGTKQDFGLIIKADVQGTAEAIKNMVEKLSTDIEEINLRVIHCAVGAISENDVQLAAASRAVIVGFHVRPSNKAAEIAKEKGVEIRRYSIIYNIIDDVKDAIEGLLAPEQREVVLGQLEVRNTFKVPKIGIIAGCYVTEGLVKRSSRIRLMREDVVIHDGPISSLKRFKDDVKEVTKGYECGVGIDGYNKDIKEDDTIEVYE